MLSELSEKWGPFSAQPDRSNFYKEAACLSPLIILMKNFAKTIKKTGSQIGEGIKSGAKSGASSIKSGASILQNKISPGTRVSTRFILHTTHLTLYRDRKNYPLGRKMEDRPERTLQMLLLSRPMLVMKHCVSHLIILRYVFRPFSDPK
jgi:hypothetical protein